MNIKYNYIQPISLQEFAERYNLTMVVNERDHRIGGVERFYAEFEDCEVRDGALLISAIGNGHDEFDAIENYARSISGRTLVMTMPGKQVVIPVPKLKPYVATQAEIRP